MSNINRDDGSVELNDPPAFNYGEKVKSKKVVRNDGTFAGKDVGEVLVKKGEVGYVISIGTFLQQFYIYGVEFVDTGYKVGMRKKELEPVEAVDGRDEEMSGNDTTGECACARRSISSTTAPIRTRAATRCS